MDKIPITKPYLYPDEEKAVLQVLRSGWLTQGEQTTIFEKTIAAYVGAKYAIACNSCTTALFLSLKILGIKEGDEVIVPSYTFIASPNSILQTGARPVFADIDLATYNVNADSIARSITNRTRAIMIVDQVGLPADLKGIQRLAKRYKLKIVEDAACALGSTYFGRRIGSISEVSCFSFHPRKLITTGEGGMITTDNAAYAQALQMLVSHGASVSEVDRHQSKKAIRETYPVMGYNFRLSNIQGAMGVAQMKKLDWILQRRIKLAERYNQAFSCTHTIIPPVHISQAQPNYQTYMVRLSSGVKITRETVIKKLAAAGIASRAGIMACHLEPLYRAMYPRLRLPNTETALRSSLILPLYPEMTERQQNRIIDTLLKLVE
ncbi:MAG: DegT/DnrJ/EryC1/StrS family aminotransferase [bacterium]|nr:DegT/DnrJ/EryC1/StrS family aminotransferase [bacterium]